MEKKQPRANNIARSRDLLMPESGPRSVCLVMIVKNLRGKLKWLVLREYGVVMYCGNGVKSVISRFCSNTTARVKRKIKDVQPGKPPRWWFVIHDSEESLQALEENWGSVHVQTNWKLEPCYKPMDSDNSTQPSTLPPPTTPTEINMLPSETPTVDVMHCTSQTLSMLWRHG